MRACPALLAPTQRPPTGEWTDQDLVQLLSRASYHAIDRSQMMQNEKAIAI